VHLEPAGTRPLLEEGTVMRCAQTHADAERGTHVGYVRHGLHGERKGLLRCGQAAAGLLASALGDVLPFGLVVVDLALSGAGMDAGIVGAIVLPGLGDTEALFLGGVGSVGSAGGGKADGGEGGGK